MNFECILKVHILNKKVCYSHIKKGILSMVFLSGSYLQFYFGKVKGKKSKSMQLSWLG